MTENTQILEMYKSFHASGGLDEIELIAIVKQNPEDAHLVEPLYQYLESEGFNRQYIEQELAEREA
jgi:hypothetical protein